MEFNRVKHEIKSNSNSTVQKTHSGTKMTLAATS